MKTGKILSVYLSGYLTGIALVLYPAAGGLFTDANFHNLSSLQYGTIFIPQIVLAIIASLSAPRLINRIGIKNVLILGIISLLLSMSLFATSHWFYNGQTDYYFILSGTAFIGAAFGLGITALNPLAYSLFPGKETSAVTGMHIMLGLGTASSALLLSNFIKLNMWWGAPLMVVLFSLALLLIIFFTSLDSGNIKIEKSEQKSKVPAKIWLFAFGVFLYGACEATFGNFGTVFLQDNKGLNMAMAALGLSLFWGGITVGRLLFTFIALRFRTDSLLILAPFLVGLIFLLMPASDGHIGLLACMAAGGLGMSFIFPKSISYTTDKFPEHSALISGVMVAAIQLGTGLSSNIIGWLGMTIDMGRLFQFSSIYAFSFGILLLVLIKLKKKK